MVRDGLGIRKALGTFGCGFLSSFTDTRCGPVRGNVVVVAGLDDDGDRESVADRAGVFKDSYLFVMRLLFKGTVYLVGDVVFRFAILVFVI